MKFVEGEQENGDQDHDKDEESDSKDNGMVSINILQTNLFPIATGSSHAQLTMPMSVMKMMTAKEKKAMKALALMSG